MIDKNRAHRYCKDDITKIANYDKAIADTTQTWVIHHRLELTLDGDFAHSKADLIRMDMYYHRPYFELIFLPKAEHISIHKNGKNNPMYGKHFSKESRKKISESLKGKACSEEHRRKLSEANKGKHHSNESRKKMSASHKGKTFTTEHRQKMREAAKARWARYRQEKGHTYSTQGCSQEELFNFLQK